MGAAIQEKAQLGATAAAKVPRTPRGERTLRKILDAAREEFGERGFSDSSIVGITQRAGVALGTFYTYFDSKEALFQALVRDMSAQVRDEVGPASRSGDASTANAPRSKPSFGSHTSIATSIASSTRPSSSTPALIANIMRQPRRVSLRVSSAPRQRRDRCGIFRRGTRNPGLGEMGANVFLGLRFAVWASADRKRVADTTSKLLRSGTRPYEQRGSKRNDMRTAISSSATASGSTIATIRLQQQDADPVPSWPHAKFARLRRVRGAIFARSRVLVLDFRGRGLQRYDPIPCVTIRSLMRGCD